jgi:hypothetical protein
VEQGRVEKPASTVYFVRIGKFIKIGFTTDLERRLAGLRGASAERMSVLLTIPGERDVEQRLHKLFAAQRVRNEFFHDAMPIRNFIDLAKRYEPKRALANVEAWHLLRTQRLRKGFGGRQPSTHNVVVRLFPENNPLW